MSSGPNVSTTPLRQWGFQQCLPFSWTTLRGKHCWHPIAVMGVVDLFGPNIRFCFIKRPHHMTLLKGLWPQQATATKYTQISSTAHLKFLEYVNIASFCACSKMHIKQMFWQFCFLLKRHRINKWNDEKKKSINIISTCVMTNSMLLLT